MVVAYSILHKKLSFLKTLTDVLSLQMNYLPCKGPPLHDCGCLPYMKALLLYTAVKALKMTQEVEVERHKLHALSSGEVLHQTTG